eukprot:488809-Rhodomonas_salina.2
MRSSTPDPPSCRPQSRDHRMNVGFDSMSALSPVVFALSRALLDCLAQLRGREEVFARKRAADELLPVQACQVRPELVHIQARDHPEAAVKAHRLPAAPTRILPQVVLELPTLRWLRHIRHNPGGRKELVTGAEDANYCGQQLRCRVVQDPLVDMVRCSDTLEDKLKGPRPRISRSHVRQYLKPCRKGFFGEWHWALWRENQNATVGLLQACN